MIPSKKEGRFIRLMPDLLSLEKEISKYFERTINIKYAPEDEIVVTVGGSEAIDISIRTIVEPGDEVLIVEPCFVCYSPIVSLSGEFL